MFPSVLYLNISANIWTMCAFCDFSLFPLYLQFSRVDAQAHTLTHKLTAVRVCLFFVVCMCIFGEQFRVAIFHVFFLLLFLLTSLSSSGPYHTHTHTHSQKWKGPSGWKNSEIECSVENHENMDCFQVASGGVQRRELWSAQDLPLVECNSSSGLAAQQSMKSSK